MFRRNALKSFKRACKRTFAQLKKECLPNTHLKVKKRVVNEIKI